MGNGREGKDRKIRGTGRTGRKRRGEGRGVKMWKTAANRDFTKFLF